MLIFKLAVAGLWLLFAASTTAQPIVAKKLFTSAQYTKVQLSPDGLYASAHFTDDKVNILYFVNLSTNAITSKIDIGKDYHLDEYHWINPNRLYVHLNTDKGPAEIVINKSGDTVRAVLVNAKGYLVDTLDSQPNHVMYAKRRKSRGKYYNLYIIELQALIDNDFDQAQQVEHDSKDVGYYVYDSKGKRIITGEYDNKDKTITIQYTTIGDGKWRTAFKLKDTEYRLEIEGFIDDQSIAVLTNKNSDKMVLTKLDIKTQQLGDVIYQHPKYDLTSAGFDAEGKLNYVRYQQHGLTKTRYFDKGKAHFIKRLAKTFVNQNAYIIEVVNDGNLALLYVNGSAQPGEFYLYNQKTDKASPLLLPYPELEKATFAPSKYIKVIAADGTEIEAFLTLPQGLDQSTLLVMPHGGPIGVQESDRFNKEVQYFASRGFAVLRINFRGSAGFGKAFSNQGVGEFGRLIEEDITAVVNQVVKQHHFNNRCAIGSSYGGYSATMLAIAHPDEYDCVIAAYGVYDLPLVFNASNYRSGEKHYKKWAKVLGEFDETLLDVSPVYIYKQLKTPLLLIAGREDDIADFEHTNRFKYQLQRNKHPLETLFYHKTGHGHATWYGDRHEAAFTYDYLVRTLKLNMPTPQQLDTSGKQAIADDYAAIADGYNFDSNFDSNVDNDKQKAFEYYQKAADYHHGRATFNIGARYHTGREIKYNVAKAIDYYQKSAAQDYAPAHTRLGRMYMEGEHFAQDWPKALTHLLKAQTLDDTPHNNIRLARFYCSAPGERRDIDRCLELMDLAQYKKLSKVVERQAKREIRHALASMIIDVKYTASQLERIQQFATTAFKLTTMEASLESIEEGTFNFIEGDGMAYGKASKYELLTPGRQVTVNKEDTRRFGLRFGVDISGIDRYRDTVAIIIRWHKITQSGQKSKITSMLYGAPRGDNWRAFRSFENIKEGGTWRLEIYDLTQKQLYSETYHISKVAQDAEQNVVQKQNVEQSVK